MLVHSCLIWMICPHELITLQLVYTCSVDWMNYQECFLTTVLSLWIKLNFGWRFVHKKMHILLVLSVCAPECLPWDYTYRRSRGWSPREKATCRNRVGTEVWEIFRGMNECVRMVSLWCVSSWKSFVSWLEPFSPVCWISLGFHLTHRLVFLVLTFEQMLW